MKKTLIPEDVVSRVVRKAIVEALEVEEDMVTPEASLIDDLGAESLDFIDIAFRLERTFDLQMPRESFLDRLTDRYDEELFVREGELTDAALELFKEMMPEIDRSRLRKGLVEEEVVSFFTVNTWVRNVQNLLAAVPESCEKCGGETVANKVMEGEEEFFQYVCSKCKEKVPIPSGEDVFYDLVEKTVSLPAVQLAIEKEKEILAKIKRRRVDEEE